MKTFDELRRKVGSILGTSVPKGGIESVILDRDREGALGHKQVIRILIALYSYIEEHDDRTIQENKTV